MDVRILGCYGAEMPGFRTSCFKINDSILVDAGAVTSVLSRDEQIGIRDILVTHSHLDHIKDIPLLADNVIGCNSHYINVISTKEVIGILREHLFNFKIWPDFSKIPTPENPVIRFREIETGKPFDVNGLTVTAVEVHHTVPAVGYIISDGKSSLAVSGDTCHTDKLWELINATADVKAIFLETSFPNNMEELANISGHLTPEMMGKELKKLNNSDIPVYLYHLKPNFLDVLKEQISAVDYGKISLLKLDNTFSF